MGWNNWFGRWGFNFMIKNFWYSLLGGLKPYSVKEYLIRNVNMIALNYTLPKFTGTNDEKMLKILKWCVSNFHYVYDQDKFGQAEMWEDAYINDGVYKNKGFAQTMTGDCESGATLLYAMARANRISSEQLRLWTGTVKEGYGHCTLKYRADYDMRVYAIDWCYYPDLTTFKFRRSFKDLDWYKSTWFEVTDFATER